MPELPDITVYVEHLAARIVGCVMTGVRLSGPSLLRTAVPLSNRRSGVGSPGCGALASAS